MNSSKILGYLGLIPFIVCLYLSDETFEYFNNKFAFVAYSAIILSFLAGTLWTSAHKTSNTQQLIISNVFSLTAFVSLLLPVHIAIMVLAVGFLCICVYEKFFMLNDKQLDSYLKMRVQLSFIVIALHITAYIRWFTLSMPPH
ncbi:DUF3429 domain-containing protein [Colwelliaceae bacterium 6441]